MPEPPELGKVPGNDCSSFPAMSFSHAALGAWLGEDAEVAMAPATDLLHNVRSRLKDWWDWNDLYSGPFQNCSWCDKFGGPKTIGGYPSGNTNYARQQIGHALVPALSGQQWDAPTKTLSFAFAKNAPAVLPFHTPFAVGLVSLRTNLRGSSNSSEGSQQLHLEVLAGRLEADQLLLRGRVVAEDVAIEAGENGTFSATPANGGMRATSKTPEPEVSRELRLVGGALKTDDAGPPSPWEPSFPALAPAFPPTWRLNASTIIHTGNISGWTETAAAAKYGIVSFDGNNARSVWKKTDGNDSICEATLLEQARRVKAAKTGTRVLVYRQAMLAISWMESVRAVMYDEAFAGYFLRYKSGAVWRQDGAACDDGNPDDPAGDCMVWNWTNASARRYFQDVVVGGPHGTGSDLVDGIFLDDPGPGTVAQPMFEYIKWVDRAAAGIGMSPAELETLSQATFEMISELRAQLAAQGKMAWLNGQPTSGPFIPVSDANCSAFSISLTCGWWEDPTPGPTCEKFYRTRCSQPSYGCGPRRFDTDERNRVSLDGMLPALNRQLAASSPRACMGCHCSLAGNDQCVSADMDA